MKYFIIALVISASFTAYASIYKVDQTDARVSFIAKGRPALISIKGTGSKLRGTFTIKDQKLSGTAEFEIADLTTGIDLRDEHLKDKYLEVNKYPKAQLLLVEQNVTNVSDEFPFTGTLKLHGVDKQVKGIASIKDNTLTASLNINISDFAIAIPGFQGITVAETVKIDVSSKLLMEQ